MLSSPPKIQITSETWLFSQDLSGFAQRANQSQNHWCQDRASRALPNPLLISHPKIFKSRQKPKMLQKIKKKPNFFRKIRRDSLSKGTKS